MALIARKKLLLAAVEASYGVDEVPTGAANAIQTSDLSITPLAGPTVSRNLDRPTLGNDLQIQVGTFVTLSFMVEFAGGGAPTTPPAYGPLLEGCGFAETVAADVQYDPISEGIESLSMYFHHDGQLHRILGARGSVAIQANPGEIPHFVFNFTGLYAAPASVADPTPDFTSFQVPLPVNNAAMPTFELHGGAETMVQFGLDMANEVVYRNVVGNESVELIDRAPSGNVSIEAPAISVKNWFEIARLSTLGALSVLHGTTAGNRVAVDAPNVQLISPQYGAVDGISTIDGNLSLVPGSGGNDEVKITTS